MKCLSISNIGWDGENDKDVFHLMKCLGFTGLEIAPSKVFPTNPYEKLSDASNWQKKLFAQYGFVVSSMQSIWFGRAERLFGSEDERDILLSYTKRAIDFAETIKCKNIVFGCPKNRTMPSGSEEKVAVRFFREIGDYAYIHHTCIAMEANPPIYNTNYINTTSDALSLIEQVGSNGFLLNLDIGTMIENEESISLFKGKEHLINHVHVSEPGLKPIEERIIHYELAEMLRGIEYQRFISIEVSKQSDVESLKKMMEYVVSVFGE